MRKSQKVEDNPDKRRDALLKRLLETPPKPHKPAVKKGGSKRKKTPTKHADT